LTGELVRRDEQADHQQYRTGRTQVPHAITTLAEGRFFITPCSDMAAE
jgi:hypothetical protein